MRLFWSCCVLFICCTCERGLTITGYTATYPNGKSNPGLSNDPDDWQSPDSTLIITPAAPNPVYRRQEAVLFRVSMKRGTEHPIVIHLEIWNRRRPLWAYREEIPDAHEREIVWHLRDGQGAPVPPGLYRARLFLDGREYSHGDIRVLD